VNYERFIAINSIPSQPFFRVADRKSKEIQIPNFFVETLIVLDEFD
jgi:hypothetical protein